MSRDTLIFNASHCSIFLKIRKSSATSYNSSCSYYSMSNTCLKAVVLLVTFSARFFSIFSNQPRERDQHYAMSGAFNLTSLLFILTRYYECTL